MATLETLRDMRDRMTNLMRAVHKKNLTEEPGKLEPKRYSLKDACEMIGRSYRTIRDAELSGQLEAPAMGENGRRIGFTLEGINKARDHFGTRLGRKDSDETVRLSFSNFKGGSSKTTTAVHNAQFNAQMGLRTLIVDCDPQASATATFGYAPDDDIDPDSTLLPYLEGQKHSLDYAIRKTYWDSLDLIPANLMLFDAEYQLAAEGSAAGLRRLRIGLEHIQDNYDVIILDPPPALGMISLSVMHAANAVVIPTPGAIYDLYSTRAFLEMLVDIAESLESKGLGIDYKFIRMMVTRLDENSESQARLVEILPDVLGRALMHQMIRKTAALDRAGVHGRTIYEMTSENMPRRTWVRALNHFDRANEEILTLIRRTWPSHEDAMREAAEI